MKKNIFVALILIVMLSGCAYIPFIKRDVEEPPTVQPPPIEEKLKPYEKVITADAVSDTGLFITHRVNEKLYFEIPQYELGKELLIVTRIARAQTGFGHGGERLNTQVVRWVKTGDRVLLRSVIYEFVADSAKAIFQAVQAATFEPIIASFPIETTGKDEGTVVIDVTRLFTTDVPEFAVRQRFRGRRVDGERSYVDNILTFPDNIEIRNVLTMEVDYIPQDLNLRSASIKYNHSMIRLPEEPMMPRLFDERIGYYSIRQIDFGLDTHRAEERRYIVRWRLEKKDPDVEISEPVKPITFYIDPATPEQWIPWVKKGVEEWQDAFEKAGFKNAIIAKLPPSPEEDPKWSPEDARYPTVRWFASTVQNAMGPRVHDPRTGEVLTTSIYMHHNILNLLRNWYFTQASAVDEQARSYKFPDSLMGRLLQYVVAHEVGHTLGFPHNMKASAMVPTDSLRSPSFTHKYGTTPSIMDYARMNYVAQPGDDAYMFPKVSIYDEFAIEWGYKPFPQANTPDEKKPFLNKIAARQEDNPMLLFGHLSIVDPTQQRESLGDNHVQSTKYGIENLKRIMTFLLDAAGDEGDDFRTLNELYGRIILQRNLMLGHVASWIGGVYGERKVYGQEGLVHASIPRSHQVEAMNYLIKEGFTTPEYLLDPEVLRRIEPTGAVIRIMSGQQSLLRSLLDDRRLLRIAENEVLHNNPTDVYPLEEMLDDLRKGIWRELESRQVKIDLYRRNLQRSYIERIDELLNTSPMSLSGESRAFLRGNLNELNREISRAILRAADRATKFHLEDIKEEIVKILEAPKIVTQTGGVGIIRIGVQEQEDVFELEKNCWDDGF